jgi:hypothetical protein
VLHFVQLVGEYHHWVGLVDYIAIGVLIACMLLAGAKALHKAE